MNNADVEGIVKAVTQVVAGKTAENVVEAEAIIALVSTALIDLHRIADAVEKLAANR